MMIGLFQVYRSARLNFHLRINYVLGVCLSSNILVLLILGRCVGSVVELCSGIEGKGRLQWWQVPLHE